MAKATQLERRNPKIFEYDAVVILYAYCFIEHISECNIND